MWAISQRGGSFQPLPTDGGKQAHDQQDDDTPEHVYIHLSLQFAALVARAVVVEHGFGLVTCKHKRGSVTGGFVARRRRRRRRGLTCVNDYSHGLLGVADGAASQQQVLFVKCISSAAAVDSDSLGEANNSLKKKTNKNAAAKG